jgi:hypothetical protein
MNMRETMMAMAAAKSTAIPMEGTWTGLRNFLRPFRGVHKKYLAAYVAMFEWAHNPKRIGLYDVTSLARLPAAHDGPPLHDATYGFETPP